MDPSLSAGLSITAMILAPVLGIIGAIIGTAWTRKSAREANETSKFTAIVAALEGRIERLEKQVKELEEAEARGLKIRRAQARYIRKLLQIIAVHLPQLETSLIEPDPEDAEYVEEGESHIP